MSCRICLRSKKGLVSIFKNNQGISYATMLSSVADVQIMNNLNEMICLCCAKKLTELYNFKILIERSNLIQHSCKSKIFFNNIEDVQSEIFWELLKKKYKVKPSLSTDLPFLYKQDLILYGDIMIKKLDNHNRDDTIKLETLDHDDFGVDVEISSLTDTTHKEEKQENAENFNKRTINDVSTTKICIKPVFLQDFRLISTKYKKQMNKKTLSKNKCKRKDICPYCGKITGYIKSHLWLHTEERKFKCYECNKRFYKESHLKSHEKKHSGNEIYKCDHCIAIFNTKSTIIKHMIKHQDVKEHVCKVCNKGFKWRNGLVRHTKTHNPNAKSIACEICGMSFITKYGLKHHTRVHTGERPYMCQICSQPYSYKHDFNRHCFKKHGVFIKRRSIKVMNAEVLEKEKALMKDLLLRVKNVKGGALENPFTGPQAAQAFELALKQLEVNGQLPMSSLVIA